jgi:histidinol-phosphate phosphatase family protein
MEECEGAGVTMRFLAVGSSFVPRTFFGWRSLLAQRRPHVVVAGDDEALQDLLRARVLPKRTPLFVRRSSSELLRARAPQLTAVLAPLVTQQQGVQPIADGVEVPEEPPNRTLVRRELKLPRRPFLAVQVGDLVAGSGHEATLRALAALRDGRGKAAPMVAFVGTGPDESRLHVLSHELGVKDLVLWVGQRKDTFRYVTAGDALLAPAATPTTDAALVDAAVAAVPAVVADTAAHRRRVEPDVTGLVVEADDPVALARAWAALIDNPERAMRLGMAARQRAAFHWSSRRLAAELECLAYSHLLAGESRKTRAALFVDRDGTLVRNVPYNASPALVVLEPEAERALALLRTAGFFVVVVSNQSAVARGLCTEGDVQAVNEQMRAQLEERGTDVDAIYYCPHHPEHGSPCDCRKPEPGMLFRAAREHGLDLGQSVMVGDEERDLEAGRRAGVRALRYQGDWIEVANDVLRRAWESSRG